MMGVGGAGVGRQAFGERRAGGGTVFIFILILIFISIPLPLLPIKPAFGT